MGTFLTKVLLPTDSSGDAELAATTAASLAKSTGSELHVVHVGEIPPTHYPDRYGYRALYEEDERGSTTARGADREDEGHRGHRGAGAFENGQS